MSLRKVALDCMISPRFADALNALYGERGYEFILVASMVPPQTQDEHWADVFKRFGGNFIVSGDTKIAYKPHQASAFIENGFVSIFMQHPWQSIGGHLQAAYLSYWWPTFEAKFAEMQWGTLWRAPCDSKNGGITLEKSDLKEMKIPKHAFEKSKKQNLVL